MEKLTKALMTDETGQAIVGKLNALSGQMHELAMATRGSAILFESESDISVLGDGGYLAVYVGSTNPLEISEWTGDNSLVTGHLYYLIKSGTAVASSDLGEYGGTAVTDTTLELPNVPADSETVGLALITKADAVDLAAVQAAVAEKADFADIKSLAEDISELQDGGYVADQQKISEKINDWLDEHPEATTTVEDNSLTAEKLVVGTLGYVTPEDYGAVGDGVTDDTQALQACVTAGKILHLDGIYKISAGIELHSDLHIYGFGKGKIVKDANTQTDFSALYYYDIDNIISNVIIDGLEIVGLKHWTGVTITGNLNDYGIRIKNSERVKIINCNVLDCGACAISLGGTDCKISGNTIKYTGTFTGELPNYNFGILYAGEKIVISDNTISGVIQGIISSLTNKNVIIKGNDISTNGQHGLYMEGAENVIVSGNTIHDCAICGVKFQKDRETAVFEGITISDNIIKNCGSQGVLVVTLNGSENGYIHDVIISNNNIKNCSRCINITWVNRCIINGNILTNGQEYGIYGNVCDDLTCSSNRLYMYGVNSIYIINTGDYSRNKNIKISDNYIFLSGTKSGSPACINVSTGSNMMIVNNLCIADAESEYISGYDGIKLTYNAESTYNRYLIGNVVHGFRWDFRILNNVNVTFVNNYYDKATGVPT